MITNELISYIEKSLAKGITQSEIQQKLVTTGGWSLIDVESAFKTISGRPIEQAPINQPTQPQPVVQPVAPVYATTSQGAQAQNYVDPLSLQSKPLFPYEGKFQNPNELQHPQNAIQKDNTLKTIAGIIILCMVLGVSGYFLFKDALTQLLSGGIQSPILTLGQDQPNITSETIPIYSENTPTLSTTDTPSDLPSSDLAPEDPLISDSQSQIKPTPESTTPIEPEKTVQIVDPDTVAMKSLLDLRSDAVKYGKDNSTFKGLCDSDVITSLKSANLTLASCRTSLEGYSISINLSNRVFCIDNQGNAMTRPTKALVASCTEQ